MFHVVHPNSAMHDAVLFLIFSMVNKTALCDLFINRTGRFTHANNYIGGHILFDISFTNKSEKDSNI